MSDANASRPCVIMFLKPTMGLALLENWPIKRLVLGEEIYQPVGPEWSGFYDWLRTQGGQLLGVRYSPDDETSFILRRGLELSYAAVGPHGDLCLFLTSERCFDPVQSEDQDILYDQVLVTADGQCALAFAKDAITSDELTRLKGASADWLSVQVEFGEVPTGQSG